jgi:hypothetical protein
MRHFAQTCTKKSDSSAITLDFSPETEHHWPIKMA